MDLLRVGLEAEGKVSGETVRKVLRLEFNEGMAIGSSFAKSGVALGAAVGKVLGAALDGAAGRVLGSILIMEVGSIEIEEGRLTVSIDWDDFEVQWGKMKSSK